MNQRNFLDLPVLSNAEVIVLLKRYGVEFQYWPQGLLPPAASAYLQEVAQSSFDARHEERLPGMEDHLVLDEYLVSCVSAKPIIRTEWGYLTGDRSPRWIYGTLSLMHTIGIASFMAGNTTVSPGIRSCFAGLLKAEAQGYAGVEIWPGSDVELCCAVAMCDGTESVLTEELRQIQIVDFLVGVLKANGLGQMINKAVQMDVDKADSISVAEAYCLRVPLHYH